MLWPGALGWKLEVEDPGLPNDRLSNVIEYYHVCIAKKHRLSDAVRA